MPSARALSFVTSCVALCRVAPPAVCAEVKSLGITGDDFRRLVLEGVAYGALLYDSEKQAGEPERRIAEAYESATREV